MVNQKYLDKAETLIEALPYIQRFNRKIVVVKYGGSAMLDEELKANVIKDVVLLKLIGFKPIIVHGGGKEISRWVNKVGMEPRFVNGLRVTDKDTMEIAEMVLKSQQRTGYTGGIPRCTGCWYQRQGRWTSPVPQETFQGRRYRICRRYRESQSEGSAGSSRKRLPSDRISDRI